MKSESLRSTVSRRSLVTLLVSFGVGVSFGLIWYIGIESIDTGSTKTNDEIQQTDGDDEVEVRRNRGLYATLESTVAIGEFAGVLDNLSDNDLIELIDQSVSRSQSPEISAKQELLFGTFSQTAPMKALDLVMILPVHKADFLLKTVFAEWCHTNIVEAVSAAEALSAPFREIAFEAIVEQHDVLSSSTIETIAVERNFLSTYLARAQNEKAHLLLDQPKEAFDLLVKDGISDYLQSETILHVLDLWKKKERFDVIAEVASSKLPRLLRQELLGRITEKDQMSTLQYLSNLPAQKQIILGMELVNSWSVTDGRKAFEAVHGFNYFSTRAYFIDIVVRQWAEQQPLEVFESIAEIPRKQRASGVAAAVGKLAELNLDAAIQQLDSLRSLPGAVDIFAEQALVEQWTKQAPAEALDWVQDHSKSGSERRSQLMKKLLIQYTAVEPEKAMVLALGEEPTAFDGMIGLEQYVITTLVDLGEVQTAIELLPNLRAAARPMSFATVGYELLKNNRDEEAVQLAMRLPDEARQGYYRDIIQNLVFANVARVFDTLPQLPTSDSRQAVAQFLLGNSYL